MDADMTRYPLPNVSSDLAGQVALVTGAKAAQLDSTLLHLCSPASEFVTGGHYSSMTFIGRAEAERRADRDPRLRALGILSSDIPHFAFRA
jgi:hypothetical protein